MNHIEFALVSFVGSLLAGGLGALSGLGGGVVITPLLIFLLGVDIHYAMGASLVAVIATSLAASSANIKQGYINLHAAFFFAIATTLGAIVGSFLIAYLPVHILYILFSLVLIGAAIQSFLKKGETKEVVSSKAALFFKLNGTYPTTEDRQSYGVKNVALGWATMGIAGIVSGLLGIGSGSLKMISMDAIMKFPFKVSTATSNLMVGFTAAASMGIYFKRGYIITPLVVPVVLGVLAGAFFGAKLLPHIKSTTLRLLFSILIFLLAIEMLYHGIKWI